VEASYLMAAPIVLVVVMEQIQRKNPGIHQEKTMEKHQENEVLGGILYLFYLAYLEESSHFLF